MTFFKYSRPKITLLLAMILILSSVLLFSCDGDSAPSVTTDAGTTESSPTVTDTPDTVAPTVTVDEIPEHVLSDKLTVKGKVTDNSDGVTVSVCGVSATVNGDSFYAELTLSEGINLITVVATDASGNKSEQKDQKTTLVTCANHLAENNDELKMFVSGVKSTALTHQDGIVFVNGGEVFVLDGGFAETGDSSVYKYLLTLREELISSSKLENAKDLKLRLNLIISHFHHDHIEAIAEQILKEDKFEINAVYYTKASSYTLSADTKWRNAILKSEKLKNAELNELSFGETRTFDAGKLSFKLYAPSEDWGINAGEKIRDMYYPGKPASYDCATAVENANSMWMKVTYGKVSMLFTGDVMKKLHEAYTPVSGFDGVGCEPFDKMLSTYGKDGEFDVDILKYPHHGDSRSPAMHAVCKEISPDLIIFTSLYNEYTPTLYTSAASSYNRSYIDSGLNGFEISFTANGAVSLVKDGKNEPLYNEKGEYTASGGVLFEEKKATVTPSEALSGKGTEAEPYLIGTREELAFFAKNYVTLCGNDGAHFKLTADIVWSDFKSGILPTSNWTPIGSPAIGLTPFIGTFDGDGHSISGIYCAGMKDGVMNFAIGDYYLLGNVSGFFGAVNGTVKNLIIKDSAFFGSRMVGAIVAHLAPNGKTRIENCASYALVQGSEGLGGIFGGYFERASYGPAHDDVAASGSIVIERCVNFGQVNGIGTNANSSVGGIAGSLRELKSAVIRECANYGAVNATSGCVGGIVGQGIYCDLTVENCVNAAPVVGSSLAGGIIGKTQFSTTNPKTFNNLISLAHVGATSDGRVGYINGSAADSIHQDCFKNSTCYYLDTAILVHPAGTSVVTSGKVYESYYKALTASELKALCGKDGFDNAIWSPDCSVKGAGESLPTIKTITVVKLYK